MRPFVPSKDFETSKRFYTDLGLSPRPLGADLAKAALGWDRSSARHHAV
jgi:hypothetical protein